MRLTIKISRSCARTAKSLGKSALPLTSTLFSQSASRFSSPVNFLSIFRTKGAQKMTFEQFCQALKELSPKRFPKKSKEEAEEAIFKLVEDKTPGTNATTVGCFTNFSSLSTLRKLQTRRM